MNIQLSIIIPSYNRDELLVNNITSIVENFKRLKFEDYNILVIYSGKPEVDVYNILKQFSENDTIKLHVLEKQVAPGIARNIGIQKSKSDWVWFVDDDDQIVFDNVNEVLSILNDSSSNIDLIAHSLKHQYTSITDLINRVLLFREKQEVFRFIFKRELVVNNNIKFSDGVHEDIRYTLELLLYSKNIKIVDNIIYNKIASENSITNKLNFHRIDGYIKCAKEILAIDNPIIQSQSNNFTTQLLGTVLYLINQVSHEKKIKFIEYLDLHFSSELTSRITEKYNKKHANFKYAVSLYLNKLNAETFIVDLDNCFKTHLSCKDLKHSIFLGPQEIIGCCKRFFNKGKMKGDIVLIKNAENINLNTILDRKKEVETLINSDLYEECEGCPYIERYSNDIHQKVNYISLENFNYCNMKCSYCSSKYYGGRESSYDTGVIISELTNTDLLEDDVHVVWGGGEPTLSSKFKQVTKDLIDNEKIHKIRVLSNSLKFSEDLYKFVSSEKIRIVTSIDAGTQDTFQKVRGKGNLIQVLENLKKYSEKISSHENLTIKYIITNDNQNSFEIKSFVDLVKKYGFERNFIQISCNFSYEKLTKETIFSVYELAARLMNQGFEFVYFDDLIRDRLILNEDVADEIIDYLKQNDIFNENILSYKSKKVVILWGDGYQSKWIKNNTTFGKYDKVLKIVTNNNELGSDISNENVILCPSAVQQLPDVYKDIKKINILDGKLKFVIFI